MLPTFAALLEVSDKEPTSIPAIWATALVLGALGYAAARWHRWAALPFLLLQGVGVWAVTLELRDPFVGPAMLREGGHALPYHLYTATGLAALLPIIGAVWPKRAV